MTAICTVFLLTSLNENFIDRLVRYEFGNAPQAVDSNMLTRFTQDMEKIAQYGGMTMENTADLTKALIAFAMEAYYENNLAANETLVQRRWCGRWDSF